MVEMDAWIGYPATATADIREWDGTSFLLTGDSVALTIDDVFFRGDNAPNTEASTGRHPAGNKQRLQPGGHRGGRMDDHEGIEDIQGRSQ